MRVVILWLLAACSSENAKRPTADELFDQAVAAQNEDPPAFMKARELYQRACDAKHYKSCASLGLLYKRGLGGPTDLERAKQLFKTGCDANDMYSCSELGVTYSEAQDFVPALDLLMRACGGGHARACTNVGMAYARGLGVGSDRSKALELYIKACEMSEPNACALAAGYLIDGMHVPKDEARGKQLLRRACDLGDTRSCPPK